jgi:dihydrofolate reductase
VRISIIAAVAANGVIGRDNDLPWRLPADLRRFKRLTMGHHLIMGRRTFESIGRPLPGRTTVVLSRRPDPPHPDVLLARGLEEALQMAAADDEVFVAGGAEIYALALPRADRVYLTRLHREFDGDARFPPFDEAAWELLEREDHEADERNRYPHTFLVYQRR